MSKTLEAIELKIDKSLSPLHKATLGLLTELDWNLSKNDDGYEFRCYENSAKFTTVISRPTINELVACVSKLFVYKEYLRIMVKDDECSWAVKNLKAVSSKSIAKEIGVLDRSAKSIANLGGNLTVIYLDESEHSFSESMQEERFALTPKDEYRWGSGYVTISDDLFY